MEKTHIPIYDSFKKEYKAPFGAVKRRESCVFTLRFPTYMTVEQLTLVMFRPGYKEKFVSLEYYSKENNLYNLYTCTYTPQDTGFHQYYFSVITGGTRSFIKRSGASEGTLGGTELFQLTVYDEDVKPVEWLKGGIMYQIFPDRFARSTARIDDEQPIPIGRSLHVNWNELPDWRPNGSGRVTNSDYFGGNLKGIEEKLPYLHSLGVSCLYLNPIFESHENHRYNTANFEKVDCMLGTEKDFIELCEAARQYGMRIILDGVFSHTGADSIYFNKYGRYGAKQGAYLDPESPYREWYNFSHYPNVYDSWWGFETLPNVNENNPAYTEYICGEKGILKKWLILGASGWRLDVVDELPDEFIDNLNKAVKSLGDDMAIYGEVWEDASTKESYGVRRRYLVGGQLDSVMNYPFKEIIINYIKYSDANCFKDGIMTIIEHYPKPSVDILMNFLSTHDIERVLTRLAGAELGVKDREWQANNTLSDAEYVYGIALLKCAMVLQFFLPGIPCIYYGDEAGMEGYKDPFNRKPYPWGKENIDLLSFTRELSAIRKKCKSFAEGELIMVEVTSEVCVFMRIDESANEAVTIYLNKSKHSREFNADLTCGRAISTEYLRSAAKDGIQNEYDDDFEVREKKIYVAPYDYAAVRHRIRPLSKEAAILNHQQVSEEILIYE